jgi:tRNA threonylcarbamoyladenosine biosynthesis protein TsaE
VVHETKSADETQQLAARFVEALRGGECVALDGDLGAGKTQFVRGMVRGLGGNERAVSSPTFVLLNIYEGGRLTVYHLDAYRVAGAEDLEGIGFSELLEQGGVVVVEWASRVKDLLPEKAIRVGIEHLGRNRRRISIEETQVIG